MIFASVVGVAIVATALAVLAAGPALTNYGAERFATNLPSAGLTEGQRAALMRSAVEHSIRAPSVGGEVRHAHSAVTYDELLHALEGDYQSIEGDVGLVGTTAVLRHDVRDPVGMTFDDWLPPVASAGFTSIKLDVKRDRVGPLIEQVRRGIEANGLPAHRLKCNADVLEGPGAYAGFSWQERLYNRLVLKLEVADMEKMVRAFPDATFSIGAVQGRVPEGTRYSPADAEHVQRAAARLRNAGASRLVFAARWDLLTPEFVESLAAQGVILDVWNATDIAAPQDPEAEVRRLRQEYGQALGVIDLRR